MQPGAALDRLAVPGDKVAIELSGEDDTPTPPLAHPVLLLADVHALGRCFVKRRLGYSRLHVLKWKIAGGTFFPQKMRNWVLQHRPSNLTV